jgi:hypothetical protein
MNTGEMFNREKKAAKMADALFVARVTVEDMSAATPEDWETLATAAGCKPPHSQMTKDLVLGMLARTYADAAAAADDKAEQKWEESQEYGANRCPPRE